MTSRTPFKRLIRIGQLDPSTEASEVIDFTIRCTFVYVQGFRSQMQGENPPGRIPIDALRILMQADEQED